MYYQQCMILQVIIFILIFFLRFALAVLFHVGNEPSFKSKGESAQGVPSYVWFNLSED